MNTVRKIIQSDDAGAVHVELAVGGRPRPVEVVVIWQEVPAATSWPEGWFEETAGAIQDDSFVRGEQGALEERSALG